EAVVVEEDARVHDREGLREVEVAQRPRRSREGVGEGLLEDMGGSSRRRRRRPESDDQQPEADDECKPAHRSFQVPAVVEVPFWPCKTHDLLLRCGVHVHDAVCAVVRWRLPMPSATRSAIAPIPVTNPIAASPHSNPAEVGAISVRTSAWVVAGVRPDDRAELQYWWQLVVAP